MDTGEALFKPEQVEEKRVKPGGGLKAAKVAKGAKPPTTTGDSWIQAVHLSREETGQELTDDQAKGILMNNEKAVGSTSAT